MAPYFYDNTIHVYQTPRPFTRLAYSQGPLEFINVGVTHAQQISKRLSFGLDYRRIKNQNRYYSNLQNLSTVRIGNLFNSKFYTSYYTANRKYELVASYVWNKSKNAESGGISNDTVYNALSGRQKENNIPARYTNAFNTHAQNNFKLTQYYLLSLHQVQVTVPAMSHRMLHLLSLHQVQVTVPAMSHRNPRPLILRRYLVAVPVMNHR